MSEKYKEGGILDSSMLNPILPGVWELRGWPGNVKWIKMTQIIQKMQKIS